MDEIERAVVLPAGAQPLSAYGRNYALSGKDRIVAVYLIPSPPLDVKAGCDVMLKNLAWRPCTKKEVAEMARSNARSLAAQTPAGKRRWYDDYRRLPFIDDGGCFQVSVKYDVAAHRVLSVACNGYG